MFEATGCKNEAIKCLYQEMTREIAEFRGLASRILLGLTAFTAVGVSWLSTLNKANFSVSKSTLIVLGLLVLYSSAFAVLISLHRYFRQALYAVCNIETVMHAFEEGYYIEGRTLLWPAWANSHKPKWLGEPVFAFAYVTVPMMLAAAVWAVFI